MPAREFSFVKLIELAAIVMKLGKIERLQKGLRKD
ncbi:hypothetical protein ZPR_0471 [Zunongwangia profunda SM-A87]|uniref:Uncharacterized protein n=1 Tax=Zunongwangia profunda (strain DSM 18752 / CCTCC AB 206139 / SM-A87) TaxID=655815 RepID=D5BEU9_ZUNPS|nr:hypothetical protein ZPR_0471 [Zunongwangia profunda SM-A87]